MREIKFRAWDKKTNAFYVPIYEAYKGNLFDINLSMNGQIMARDSEYKTGDMNRFICTDEYQDRFELMQYTGLKDKNGKEIYEGDVVCVEFSNGNFDKGIIEYQTGTYWINYVTNSSEELRLEYEYIEIIGNIHENPELLTN